MTLMTRRICRQGMGDNDIVYQHKVGSAENEDYIERYSNHIQSQMYLLL